MKREANIIVACLLATGISIISYGSNKSKEHLPMEVLISQTLIVQESATPKNSLRPPYSFRVANRVVSKIPNVTEKVEYTVVIGKNYDKKILDEITDYLKETDESKIINIFVSYYLEGMSLNGPNYAISKRSLGYEETEINFREREEESGKKVKSEKEVKQKAPYDGHQIVGKWLMMPGAVVVIYQKGSSYYMVDEFKNSFGDPDKLVKFSVSGKTAFRYVDDTGEVFVIMSDGLYGYMDGSLSSVFSIIR